MSEDSLELFKKYKTALMNADIGYWEVDVATGMLSWDEGNRRFCTFDEGVYGCSADEWLKKIHEDDRARFAAHMKKAIVEDSDIDIKYRVITNSNQVRYVRTRAYKIKNGNRIVKLIGLHWDITTESQLEIELTKAKEFTENILNAIPDATFVKNEKHEIIYANAEYEKLVGKRKEEFIGKNDYACFPKELADICWQKDLFVFQNNVSNENDEVIADAQKNVRNILFKRTPLKVSSTEKMLVGVLCDVTDIKSIQDSLIEQSKMASLGEMAADIAHEINNPLMIIQGKSHLLLEKIDSNNFDLANVKKDLEQIEKNCVRIDKIIKSLKSVTRKADLDPFEEVSVLKLIDEAFEISRERFKRKKLNLFSISDKEIDYNFKTKARPSEIVQVLVNLLNNSFDAIQDQERGWARIGLSLQVDGRFLIEVTDSGSEIEPEVAKKMMEPFFTTKTAGKGTGLGLSVSKQIIQNHGGELFYDASSANTRFVFTLPKL